MTKHIFAIIFAIGLSISINAGETYAQSSAFRIDIPFAFTANNKTLPAGTYTVRPASDSRIFWRVTGAGDTPDIFLLAGSLASTRDNGDARMTFRRYGDRNFLIGFRSTSYQVSLKKSASEKEFLRTQSAVAQNDTVIVEAVSRNNELRAKAPSVNR